MHTERANRLQGGVNKAEAATWVEVVMLMVPLEIDFLMLTPHRHGTDRSGAEYCASRPRTSRARQPSRGT